MRSHAKASTAGSTQRQATGLGRILRGADAARAPSPGRKGSSAPSRRLLLCLPLALLLAALFAASAQAVPTTIAGYGEGAGQVWKPKSTAVDQSSGDLYVAEFNNFRVSKFDSAGDFLLAWGWGVADGTSQELQTCGPAATPPTKRCFAGHNPGGGVYPTGAVYPEAVAVDRSSGAVYVADNTTKRVNKFTSSGQFLFMVGKNVNKTKVEEIGGPYTQAEKNICAAGETCQAGASGTGPDEFSSPVSLAVDASGAVWVGDTNRITSFSSSGVSGSEITLSGAGATTSLALDSAGDFYVKSASLAGIRKLEAGTGTLLETLDAANNPRTVTLDEADNIYIGDCVVSQFNCGGHPYRFKVYNPAGEQISQFGAEQVIGAPQNNAIAVGDSAGKLYAASSRSSAAESAVQAFPLPAPGPLPENEHVEELEPTTVTLAAELNPEGHETTYHFEWGTSESYGESGPTETLGVEEFDPEAVAEELEELIPSTTYHFRLVASNECEPSTTCTVAGPDTAFTTLPAVSIDAQWASEVAAHSAILNAELNPLGVAGHWWIEYGTSAGYGSSTAHEALPGSFGDIAVAKTLSGLSPNTTYHYRFVATDVRDGTPYTVQGSDLTFTTQLSGLGFSLADNRAWEMVSPPQKYGAGIVAPDPTIGGVVQAAAGGDAFAYLSTNSTEANPEGSRVIERSSTLARRGAGGAWTSRDLTPPHTEVTPIALGHGLEYRAFSADLSQGLLEQRDSTRLSPEATERTPYLRRNTEPAAYTPLLTSADVPPGTEFGGDPEWALGPVSIEGATPDLSHVVLRSQGVPLAEGVTGGGLYEWSAGRLAPLSVKPESEGGAVEGGTFGSGAGSTRKAISDDGSRVLFSTGGGGSVAFKALYVRDVEREETARLDVVQPGAFGTGEEAPLFQGANAAGTVALFTDTQNLTEDANESGADLYRCQVTVEAGGELGCDLTDLTADPGGESAGVQGLLSGVSEDATSAYFVATGALDAAPNSHGESAVGGQPNLYRWQQGSGVRFIATLAGADSKDWGGGNRQAAETSAAASPSGRYLAFMSSRSLTGYDNRDALTNELDKEVFRYDALTDSLVCASCNPSGAAPRGQLGGAEGTPTSVLSDPQQIWEGSPVAAILPENVSAELNGTPTYYPRVVHDDGRLFFNAADSLVPADSNGAWDVYEYEPTGAGDCSAASGGAATSLSAGGCVSLISAGTGEGESGFLDASEGGNDAFFITAAQLSVTDEDHINDVYDARVDGIPATLTPHPECQGEACQPPVNPPNEQTPASATFKGKGNLSEGPSCAAFAHRTARLSHRARRIRRHAKRLHNPKARRRMARRAGRLAHRAHSLGVRTKRCRRAERRAKR